MKVCLVDSRVKESTTFLNTVQDGVTAILIDYETDTFDSLLAKIGSVESIAYVAHGTFAPTYSFFKDSSFDMLVKADWQPFFDFLSSIDGLQYFDFLGCSLASDDRWKQVFLWIEETGVNVRASIDVTGNLASGGNWILEDGSVDAKEMYFTNLDSFHGLLVQSEHIVYMKDNALYGYGYNEYGQLGNGNTTNMTTEAACLFSTSAVFSPTFYPVQVANGYIHTVVLMSDNTIWSCGQNIHGQLGIGTTTTTVNKLTKMINPSGNTTMFTSSQYPVQIACGEVTTIILMSDNTLWGTGYNGNGQLGLNDTTSRNTLTQIPIPVSIYTGMYPVQVACGQYHTIVLMSNRTIWGTGYNANGQLGINTTSYKSVLTQMKISSNNNIMIPYSIKIACGNSYTVVLMSDNTIWSCGQNNYGQLGVGDLSIKLVLTQMTTTFDVTDYPIQIVCGESHTVVLTSSNNVWGCGYNLNYQLSQTGNGPENTLVQFVDKSNSAFNGVPINISAGRLHTYVLMSNGILYGCGNNRYGELFTSGLNTSYNTISGINGIVSRSYSNIFELYDGNPKPVTIYTAGTVTSIKYFSDDRLTNLLTGAPTEPGKYYIRATINNAITVLKYIYIINRYISDPYTVNGIDIPTTNAIYIMAKPTIPLSVNNILFIGDGSTISITMVASDIITAYSTMYIVIRKGTTLTIGGLSYTFDDFFNPMTFPTTIIIESGAKLILTTTASTTSISNYRNIINNGALEFNKPNSTTFNTTAFTVYPSISGTGIITMVGTGTISFYNMKDFTGSITVPASNDCIIFGDCGSNISNLGTVSFYNSNYITSGTNYYEVEGATGVSSTTSNTYSGSMSGTGKLFKYFSGILTLTGDNTFTGITTISGGTLIISGNYASNISKNITFNNNTNITYSGILSGTSNLTKLGTGTLSLTNINTYTGTTSISGILIINNSSAVTCSGVISGIGSLTKMGAGTLTLSGQNTYTGLTTVSAGTLKLGKVDAIPSSNTITIAGDTSVLDISGYNITLGTLSVTSGLPAGCVTDTAATKGSITASTYNMSNTNNTTISAKLAGTSGLTKSGAGVLTLSAVNTYTGGTTINGGTIMIGITNAILGNVIINGSTAVLNIQTYNISLGTLTVNDGSSTGCVIGSGIITATGYIVDIANNTTISAKLAGTSGLTKSGAGVLTLSSVNAYTGGTTINGGTIMIGILAAIYGSVIINGSTAVLNIQTYNIGLGTLTVINGSSTGCVIGTTGTITATGYIVDIANNTTISAKLAGNYGLTKSGTGVLTLSAVNTYNGGTTINGGTLMIGTANAILGNVTVNGTDAVLNIHTYNITLGTLTVINSSSAGCVIGTGTITATSNYIISNSTNTSISAILAGTSGLTKSGVGILTLTSINTYTGNTTVNGGMIIQEIIDINTLTLNDSKTSISNVTSLELDNNLQNRPNWVTYKVDPNFSPNWLQYTSLSISPNLFVTFTSSTIANNGYAYLISPPCRPVNNTYITFHFDFVNDNISTNTDSIEIGMYRGGSSIGTTSATNIKSNSLTRYLSTQTLQQANRYFVSFAVPTVNPTVYQYYIYIKFTSQNGQNMYMNNFNVTYSTTSYLGSAINTINRITNITTPTDILKLNINSVITTGGYYVFNDKLYYNGTLDTKTFVYNNILYKSGIKQTASYYSKLYYNNTWISRTIPVYSSWNSITYGNGIFVAVGNNTVDNTMTSPDGINWTLNSGTFLPNCTSVTYGNNLFVAVSSTDGVITSSNGIDWVYVTSLYDSWKSVTYGIVYGSGLFVAVASTGIVMTSLNGIDWVYATSAANNNWTSVTFGNNRFVAVASTGTGNRVMTSLNGSTWTSATVADNTWKCVTYGNNLFVAVASTGAMTSPDGFIWTTIPYSDNFTSVAYGGGLFVIMCDRSDTVSSLNKTLISSNGINWTRMAIAQNVPINCVTYGSGTFVALSLYQAMTFNYSVDYTGSSRPIDVYISSTLVPSSQITYTGISSTYVSNTAPTDAGSYMITSNSTPITPYTIRGTVYYILADKLYYNGINVTGYYNGTLYYKTGISNTYNGLSQPIPVIINSLVIDPLSITYTLGTYSGNNPINAGTYTVNAYGTHFSYTISKFDLIVTFKSVIYNGLPQSATIIESSNINVSTLPSLINIKYNDSTEIPTNAGIYNITGDGVNINPISGTFTILKKDISVISINNITKIYDKTNTAHNIAKLRGVVTGDSITLAGTYDSVNVGTNIKVTPTIIIGNNSQNYNLIDGNYTV
jgi:autotransporter-associated beta strand protein